MSIGQQKLGNDSICGGAVLRFPSYLSHVDADINPHLQLRISVQRSNPAQLGHETDGTSLYSSKLQAFSAYTVVAMPRCTSNHP